MPVYSILVHIERSFILNIAVVVQRFGVEIVGGAEAHARLLAERLSSYKELKLTILTTTAKDHHTWKNHFNEGASTYKNLKVIRFKTAWKSKLLFAIYKRTVFHLNKLPLHDRLTHWLEKIWIILQGPYSKDIVKYLKTNEGRFDRIIFFTYLYYPTQFGLPSVNNFSILIPTAHDETPFYFSTTKRMLKASHKILVNSEIEKDLVERVSGRNDVKILGLGFDHHKSRQIAAALPYPYLLYLGRIDRSKHVDHLLDYFAAYINQHEGSHLRLILCGQLGRGINVMRPNVDFLGKVSEEKKLELIQNALIIVNPSSHESLSMLALESFLYRKPLLVNLKCPLFTQYNSMFPSVFGYSSQQDFISQISSIDEKLTDTDFSPAKNWVEKKL